MVLICLICFGVLIAGLSILYGLFGEKNNTRGVMICGLLMLSVVGFCLTLLNLTSFSSAVAIFFPLAITSFALGELTGYANIEGISKKHIKNIFFDIALALFTVGVIVLGEFNFVGHLCGELGGLCLGLLFWAVRKTSDKLEIATSVIGYLLVGMMIGGGVWNLICATHFISSILTLGGSVLLLVTMILKTFDGNNKIRMIERIVLPIALSIMALGVYFF